MPQSDFAPDQTCWSRDDKGWRAHVSIKGRHYIIIDTIVNLFKSNFEFIATLIIVTRKLIVPDRHSFKSIIESSFKSIIDSKVLRVDF